MTNKSEAQIAYGTFHATADARARLAPNDLLPINLDVQMAVATVLGALPRLQYLREDIAAQLRSFDFEQFDAIQSYAEALAFAQTAYLAASEPSDALPRLVARASELREQLLADATALARRRLIDGKRLAELKGGTGYLNVGTDVAVLVHVLRECWNDIQSKSAIQASELDEAEQLYERITMTYAERTQPSNAAVAAARERQRAYTLMVNAYDQARRAATYLRWSQNDADKLIPSLWAGRGGRGSQKSSRTPSTEQQVSPVPVTEAPVAPVSSGSPESSPFVD